MLSHHLLTRSIDPSPASSPNTSSALSLTLAQFQTTRMLHALQPAPGVRFDNAAAAPPRPEPRNDNGDEDEDGDGGTEKVYAHRAGVNALVVDRFEGR